MPFLIDAMDGPGMAEVRQRVRPEHLDYLNRCVDLLLAAGAKLSDDGLSPCGTFHFLALEDRASAEAFLAADPYAEAGMFDVVTMTRVRKGFFDFARVTA